MVLQRWHSSRPPFASQELGLPVQSKRSSAFWGQLHVGATMRGETSAATALCEKVAAVRARRIKAEPIFESVIEFLIESAGGLKRMNINLWINSVLYGRCIARISGFLEFRRMIRR